MQKVFNKITSCQVVSQISYEICLKLKVDCDEKQVGSGKMAYIRYWSRTAAIEVCLSFNFAVIFNFNISFSAK